MPKTQNFEFYYLLTTLAETLPRSIHVYMNFGEQIWCGPWDEMSFETFTPIWSHINENEKQI